MENKIGQDFDCLAQRILYGYAGAFPPFIPARSGPASEESQRQFHAFMKNVSERLFAAPDILGLPAEPDDSYGDWELQNRKPELIVSMRNHKKKIDEFYALLMRIGELGEVRDGRLHVKKTDVKLAGKTLKKLSGIGLMTDSRQDQVAIWSDGFPGMPEAWKMLATTAAGNEQTSALVFSHCMFDPSHPYSSDILKSLMRDPSAFQSLVDFFARNGYTRVDAREDQLSVDWVKSYAKKEEPLKASWAERTHGGISIYYDYKKKNQIMFGLRIPRFADVLAHFAEMDDPLQEFVLAQTKKCDDCGYCTQTDKTGTRKPLTVTVVRKGEHQLCPLFPGFSYAWTRVDEKTAANMIGLLSFIDALFESRAGLAAKPGRQGVKQTLERRPAGSAGG